MPTIILTFISLCHLIMGFGIYYTNPHKRLNKAFLLFCLALFGWNFLIGFSLLLKGNYLIFFARTSTIFAILLSIVFVYFARNFPDSSYKPSKKFLYINGIILALFLPFVYTNLYISNIEVVNYIPHYKIGIMYDLAVIYGYSMLFWGLSILTRKFFTAQKEEKAQLFLLIFGVLLSMLIAIVFIWFLPLLGYFHYNFLGMAGTIFFIISCGLAITKYHLLQISKTLKYVIIWGIIAILGICLLTLVFYQKINTLILICTALFLFGLGFFILRVNYKNSLNIAFFLSCFVMGWWIFFYGACYLAKTDEMALLIQRVAILSGPFIPSFFFYLTKKFPEQEYKLTKKYIILNAIIIIPLFFFLYTKHYISSVNIINNTTFFINYGVAFILYNIYLIGMVSWGICLLFIKSLTLTGEKKLQIVLFDIGVLLSFSAALIFGVFLPFLGLPQFNFLSPVCSVFIVIFLALAILKYHLMQITVIIGKTLAYTTALTIALSSLVLAFYYLHHNTYLNFISMIGLAGFWAFATIPLGKLIITGAKHAFIPGYYDIDKFLNSIFDNIHSEMNREDIFKAIETHLDNFLKFDKIGFIIAERDKDDNLKKYVFFEKESINSPTYKNIDIETSNPIIHFFKTRQVPVSFSELDQDAANATLQLGYPKSSVFLPFNSPEILEGIVILGERSGNISYTQRDYDCFRRLIKGVDSLLYSLTPFEKLKKEFELNKQKLFDAEKVILNAKKEEAESANLYKSQFLAQMTHDLRTPLHVIIGILNILTKSQHISQIESIQKSVTIALKSAERQLQLVNSILDLSKVESGKMEMRLEPFYLNELCEGLPEQMDALLKNKPVRFVIDNELAKQNSIISADKLHLGQVITNLLSNSSKFTETGEIRLNIYKKLEDNFYKLYFRISDTGIGMSQENVGRLFNSYTQIENELQKKYQGTGLGLSICRGFIEAHQGQIWAESELGKGSTFIFWIPYIELNKKDLAKNQINHQFNRSEVLSSIKHKRILMIDDDEFNLSFAQMILDGKLQYDLVDSGQNGITKAKQQKYDLIFLDLNMPGMNGKDTFKELRKFDTQTPIIALTAEAMKGTKEELESLGFSGYLTKPFNEEDLLAFIAKDALK